MNPSQKTKKSAKVQEVHSAKPDSTSQYYPSVATYQTMSNPLTHNTSSAIHHTSQLQT